MSSERTLSPVGKLEDDIESAWRRIKAHCRRSEILSQSALLIEADAFEWLKNAPDSSVHAVVTDPPYGVVEYEAENHSKLRSGFGGVWRIPPSFDGARRQPVP